MQSGTALAAVAAVQASDDSANYAIIEDGNVLFSSDGAANIKDHGDVTITIAAATVTLSATNVTFDDGSGTFSTTAHANNSDTYILKDSNNYCWNASYIFNEGGVAYTAVVETTETGTAYESACANVGEAAPVAAPFASYLGLPMLFAAFAGVGFVANKRKKS